MDLRLIQQAALERGITLRGLDEVTAKVHARFGDSTPRPAELAAFLDGLDTWTKIGLDRATFDRLPPVERMTLARSFVPPVPVHPRRPPPDFRPNEAQLAELDTIASTAERMARFRQMRDAP